VGQMSPQFRSAELFAQYTDPASDILEWANEVGRPREVGLSGRVFPKGEQATAREWQKGLSTPISVLRAENVRSRSAQREQTKMADISREEIDAKIAVSEARGDTKFAELLGEIKAMRADITGQFGVLTARVEHVERSTSGLKAIIVGTGIAAVGVVIAVLAFGDQLFGLGIGASDIANAAAQKAIQLQSVSQPPSSAGK